MPRRSSTFATRSGCRSIVALYPAVVTLAYEIVRVSGPVYLGVLTILWAVALPAYFAASQGFTADGTPVGSLPHAAGAFLGATLCLTAVHHTRSPVTIR